MGEYAEMMLDGTLCEACGTFIDFDGADGFPRYCSNQCARDRGALHALPNTVSRPNPNKTNCPVCQRRVKRAGLADHIRDLHPETTMSANRQYVACKFRSSDTRTYTYAWDGEPLAPGDFVKVEDRSGDGWKRVEVVSITDEAPPFACKPILGKLTPEELDAALSGASQPNPTAAGDALSAPVVDF